MKKSLYISLAKNERGFALIATISVMVLLALIALALISLSTITLRSTSNDKAIEVAKSNARLALMQAIANLQEAAGPDQRVTATADILSSDSVSVSEGRARWMGVWDTKEYDPKLPEEREHLGWLVSMPPGQEVEPDDAVGSNDLVIFNGIDDAESVRVPRVSIDKGANIFPGSYAYWVEDEGVKADLGWNEGGFDNDAQKQIARLSAAPGPDYEAFEGPFIGQVTYPINLESGNTWLENIEKALSAVDMPLVLGVGDHERDWLQENRHNFTLGSLGVMSDTKLGGLRRDLSLAFEMDGDAELATWDPTTISFSSSNTPDKFLSQFGEFVGETEGSDVFTGFRTIDGFTARYVYADNSDAGLPFSGDIQASSAAIRGPSWFALRDYANAYKRLNGTQGDYTISSRPTYPNSASTASSGLVIEMVGSLQNSLMYDGLEAVGGAGTRRYLEKPFQVNYAPVVLGYTVFLSVTSVPEATGEKLALAIDPIFYVWNPYNHRLTSDRFMLSYRTALPGRIRLWIDGVERGSSEAVREYIGRAAGFNPGNFSRISYTIDDLNLAPGEIKIYSPPVDQAQVSSGSAHPYNTDAIEGVDLSVNSGTLFTKFPPSWDANGINLADISSVSIGLGMTGNPDGNFVMSSFSNPNLNNSAFRNANNVGRITAVSSPKFYYSTAAAQKDEFRPAKSITDITQSEAVTFSRGSISGSKQFCGVFSMLTSPVNYGGPSATPVEPFARFNPLAQANYGRQEADRVASWNQEVVVISEDFGSLTGALDAVGITIPAVTVAPASRPVHGYWGNSYQGDGSGSLLGTVVPMIDVPTGPIMSLAHFSHANLGILGDDPLFAVGNSHASLFIDPVSPYGVHKEEMDGRNATNSDVSWLLNDALFDRYYLSGIAPEFTLSGSYQETGSLEDTLTDFFGENYKEANANPVLRPYLPSGVSTSDVVGDLMDDDGKGYLKMGAYSLINGMFNVNSTSVEAWKSLLRGNKGLEVAYAQGGNNSSSNETPFPRGTSPVSSNQAAEGWAELSRLSDSQIDDLAQEIVNQVKLRGPFMSLSDFVNHRVGTPKRDETHYMGALQAAIEDSGINSDVISNADGTTVDYESSALNGSFAEPVSGNRPTTTGIVTDITQADLLLPLAPRLSARSDTFRIRAYGEVLSDDGTEIIASAMCEAIVQRIPEYVDTGDDPWLEANYDVFASDPGDPRIEKADSNLSAINERFGRKFKITAFRWLSNSEI